MLNLKELEEKFSDIESRSEVVLASLLSEARSKSYEKIISKGPSFNIRPYEVERAGFKKGKHLKKLPANIKNTYVYHLDEDKRIIFVEVYGQSENIINYEFFCYAEGRIERIYFTSLGRIRNISVTLLKGDSVVKDFNWGGFGCSESDYEYLGSRLDKILVRQKEHVETAFSSFEVRFEYHADELMRIVNIFPNGYEEQRFP